MMNSENASNNIVQLLIDLVNMAKWLVSENHQPSVTQELGRLFPSIRGRWRRGESSELLRVGAGESSVSTSDTNNNSFIATWSTTNRRLKKYGDQKQHQRNCQSLCRLKQHQEKLPVILLFFPCVKPSDFRFVTCFISFLKFDLP